MEIEGNDQAYLNEIEENIRNKADQKEAIEAEAEQRAREMERIRKATVAQPSAGKPAVVKKSEKSRELEQDPRYKEYFERLNRQKGEKGSAGQGSAAPNPPAKTGAAAQAKTDSKSVGPGSIVRFDDGSIGVYKDAVSGRDYALFYFLRPDGQFEPEGVFLQCYQAKAIGALPENYFAQLRDESHWDRDMIVFHLSSFDHVGFLNNLAEHEERKPKNTGAGKTQKPSASGGATAESVETKNGSKSADQSASASESVDKSAENTEGNPPAASEPEKSKEGLERGQKFQINFGGKKWEAVYWTTDSDGAIVAHSTHGDWSLMRLDLDRFKDSLQLGDIVDSETMDAIANSAASAK